MPRKRLAVEQIVTKLRQVAQMTVGLYPWMKEEAQVMTL